MTLTETEKEIIRTLIGRANYMIGRPDDHYRYVSKLEDLVVVRLNNPLNIYHNGRIGIVVAEDKNTKNPMVLFDNEHWISIDKDHLDYIGHLFELGILKNEWKEREQLQKDNKPITDDDLMDLHIDLELLDKGIDIFNRKQTE